ncbi:peptidase S9 prolyl oligopeptidase active site domain-containing protein [Alicyclobacillus hesperidum URH17-3-68]|nr:peptidase S9 prolyl oligopeptidase active site domain-containing protein [Alicyclobacillus hesperidum URH17-3-68]
MGDGVMAKQQLASYGAWASPLSADKVVQAATGLGSPKWDGESLYWLESRPHEAGRIAIVKRLPDGREIDCLPIPFNARSRVHEYGGGAYAVKNDVVYFVNFSDQCIYRVRFAGEEPLPPESVTQPSALRFGDLFIAEDVIFGVVEDHGTSGEPVNSLAVVRLADGRVDIVASGHDFYAYPRLSADGRRLAYIAWDHPNMPWNGTYLYVADWDGEKLANAQRIAGGREESIFQPEWSPRGQLFYVSDKTNWWNLYAWDAGGTRAVAPRDVEFGRPLWQLGSSTYAFIDHSHIVATYVENGFGRLCEIDVDTGTLTDIETAFTGFDDLFADGAGGVFCVAMSTRRPAVIAKVYGKSVDTVKFGPSAALGDDWIAEPEAIVFPTTGGEVAYGFYYPPTNPQYVAPASERPPLLVMSHGGPTSAARPVYKLSIQYWTTRGFGVLDVNYGGSTGYGRKYRERLAGQWGIVDLDDCCQGALYLVERGDVDRDRLCITGGSAGGYTTLAVLAFRDLFRVGASHYGVSDLALLAKETHKFESRYIEQLVGRYPEERERFVARSPLQHVDQFACPAIFFQGEDDKVVPPNQAELMVEALKRKGVPVAYLLFPGEGHGFRKAENAKRALEAQLFFFGAILNFTPADPIDPVPIENWSK